MAQGFGIGKEVAQGIGITLVLITICVFIGSQIAVATSHGPDHGPEGDAPIEKEQVEKTEKPADPTKADKKEAQ